MCSPPPCAVGTLTFYHNVARKVLSVSSQRPRRRRRRGRGRGRRAFPVSVAALSSSRAHPLEAATSQHWIDLSDWAVQYRRAGMEPTRPPPAASAGAQIDLTMPRRRRRHRRPATAPSSPSMSHAPRRPQRQPASCGHRGREVTRRSGWVDSSGQSTLGEPSEPEPPEPPESGGHRLHGWSSRESAMTPELVSLFAHMYWQL